MAGILAAGGFGDEAVQAAREAERAQVAVLQTAHFGLAVEPETFIETAQDFVEYCEAFLEKRQMGGGRNMPR